MRRTAWPALAVTLLAAGAGSGRAADLTPEQAAGKVVFLDGVSPSGATFSVRIGRDPTPMPASVAACGTCHGPDGLGRPEGGVVPSEITWTALTRPHGHSHPNGRSHPPYDERSLARALREGVDPAGNPLDPVMPRFVVSDADVASLVAYLKVVDRDLDPGIAVTSLRIGVLLPDRGPLAASAASMRKLLEARARGLDDGGGVNGRRIELVFAGYDPTSGGASGAAERLVREDRVFALVSGLFPGDEAAVAAVAQAERLPVVGPFSPLGADADAGNPWMFLLVGGLGAQARVLVAHAVRDLAVEPARVVVLHPDAAPAREAARQAAPPGAPAGGGEPRAMAWSGAAPDASLVRRLASSDVRAVVFLGGEEALAAFLREADAARYVPFVLASGALAARAATRAPASFRDRLRLAYPVVPSDESPDAARALARLRAEAGATGGSRAALASASVAFDVLLEGLRRTGRQLSRERLVASLEQLWEFPTGLQHPVTFGPARRVGALGAHVVSVDLETGAFSDEGGWRSAE